MRHNIMASNKKKTEEVVAPQNEDIRDAVRDDSYSPNGFAKSPEKKEEKENEQM